MLNAQKRPLSARPYIAINFVFPRQNVLFGRTLRLRTVRLKPKPSGSWWRLRFQMNTKSNSPPDGIWQTRKRDLLVRTSCWSRESYCWQEMYSVYLSVPFDTRWITSRRRLSAVRCWIDLPYPTAALSAMGFSMIIKRRNSVVVASWYITVCRRKTRTARRTITNLPKICIHTTLQFCDVVASEP